MKKNSEHSTLQCKHRATIHVKHNVAREFLETVKRTEIDMNRQHLSPFMYAGCSGLVVRMSDSNSARRPRKDHNHDADSSAFFVPAKNHGCTKLWTRNEDLLQGQAAFGLNVLFVNLLTRSTQPPDLQDGEIAASISQGFYKPQPQDINGANEETHPSTHSGTNI